MFKLKAFYWIYLLQYDSIFHKKFHLWGNMNPLRNTPFLYFLLYLLIKCFINLHFERSKKAGCSKDRCLCHQPNHFTRNKLSAGTYVTIMSAMSIMIINGIAALYRSNIGLSKRKLAINKFNPTGGVE